MLIYFKLKWLMYIYYLLMQTCKIYICTGYSMCFMHNSTCVCLNTLGRFRSTFLCATIPFLFQRGMKWLFIVFVRHVRCSRDIKSLTMPIHNVTQKKAITVKNKIK